MKRYTVTTELFSLPSRGGHLVYAPLLRTSVLVNGSAQNLLADIVEGRPVSEDGLAAAVVERLAGLGLIAAAGTRRPPAAVAFGEAVADVAAQQAASARAHAEDGAAFRPTGCTLFLTGACNLRCVYCYASGGDDPRTMQRQVAFAAVDLACRNADELDAPCVELAFHGGGEPTLAWPLMAASVSRAERRCTESRRRLSVGVATNGVVGPQVRHWLARHATSATVSLDGPPEVQDRLRPLAAGGGTYEAVAATLRALSASPCSLGVRVTCTAESADRVPATVRFLLDEVHPEVIHLEPLFVCGRSVSGGERPPASDAFVELFRACSSDCEQAGVRLAYSGARAGSLGLAFCQASRPSFNVTPAGDVTSCYEVTGPADPRSSMFLYGAFERGAPGAFRFDEARIHRLRRLTVAEASRCRRCFAKYHCAGDCPSKRLFPGAEALVAERCAINRRLTLDQLERELAPSAASAVAGPAPGSVAAPVGVETR